MDGRSGNGNTLHTGSQSSWSIVYLQGRNAIGSVDGALGKEVDEPDVLKVLIALIEKCKSDVIRRLGNNYQGQLHYELAALTRRSRANGY
jgi:hypothetical protein